MPAARPQMKEGRSWNRALLIAARSRQPNWNRFFHHRVRRQATPRRTSTRGATVKPFAMTRVSDRRRRSRKTAAPPPAWRVQDLASSRFGQFKIWPVQDLARPACTAKIGLSLTLGALRGGLAFLTTTLGIELFVKRKRPQRGLLTFTPRLLRP
jgi:hypothetical protein